MKSFKYTINGNVYKVHINSVVEDTAEIEVNGTPYNVKMEKPAKTQVTTEKKSAQPSARPAAAAPAAPVARPAAAPSSGAVAPSSGTGATVKSPLPGIILDVKCKAGDVVKRGQTLIVLEAMKMENSINADRDGSIVEVKVNKGDSVLENADLVVIG
ncbi:Glutaconyl-CoA decarboxylase subunit gamma [Bacteroidales bacterium Barb7]|nr:Glutaconyl-CoA decarboxylase subunit gamma [Bacteroidales bacterium Barb7]